MRAVEFDELPSGMNITEPVRLSRSFLDRVRNTLMAWEYEMNWHHQSGFALYGFWGLILGIATLCNLRETVKKNSKEQRLGSYHQCYRLDGRLIAIGVLDLLPHAVSGVYFLYHQDFEKWSFGKLSAMREAALALEGGYEFYYMGFYIHNCIKMRYKGDYKPQYVLDPETNEWNPLEGELRELMDKQKYVSLSREHIDKEEDKKSYLLETSVEVFKSKETLFKLGMPGMMSPEEVEAQVDLSRMRIHLSKGITVDTEDLVAWESGDITDPRSIRGIVGEFAALVGPRVAASATMDFSQD
ncbi:arginine-tRNA-protein transferase 1 [Aureobasidium pullulans]|uniref:Arginine-tRNA-protein transferase 1 n=1 Tax=Aureobasidium pullulans TaxID=5580 RepID=A0A4V6THJ3_AURPU|nr:arginine-tRNA-protein transferase 1 [Aureobasidium pullulans]